MTDPEIPPRVHRRSGDREDFDPRQQRRYYGEPQPSDFVNGSEVKVGWGDKALTLRGPMGILVVLLVTLGAVGFYFHDIQTRQHGQQLRATNAAICVSLYDFDERKILRQQWKEDKQAVRYWCPSIGETDP